MTSRILAAAIAAAALGAVPASAAPSRACSDGDRFLQQLRVTDTGCATGRRVMYGWARSSSCIHGDGDLLADRVHVCRVRGFRCTPRAAEGGVTVRCVRQGAVVRFFDSQG